MNSGNFMKTIRDPVLNTDRSTRIHTICYDTDKEMIYEIEKNMFPIESSLV